MREDWIECKLGELSTKITDGTHHKPIYTNTGIHFISVKDIRNDVIDFSNTKFISEEDHKLLIQRCNPEEDDLLITKSGTIGRMAIVPKNCNFSLFVSVALIKNKKEYILTKYLKFYLENYLKSFSVDQIIKGGVLKNYHLEDLRLANVILVSLPEQRAIVKKLESLFSSLDAGVDDLKKAQQQLKIYRQAVLKKAFEGELTKDWREKNGLHNSLQNIKIKDLGNIVTGNTPTKSDLNNYKSEDYNFYKPTDLNKGLDINLSTDKVSAFAYEKSRKVYRDSILVTCIGATIGKTGLVTKEGIFNQQINAIIPNEKYISKFIYFQIISISFQNLLISKSSSTTMPIINKSKFQDLSFVAFTLSEQKEIVKEIESRLSVCDAIEQNIKESLEKAEALRQSILKKAFEGHLLTAQELAACKLAHDYEPANVLLERIKAEQNKTTAKPNKKKQSNSAAK